MIQDSDAVRIVKPATHDEIEPIVDLVERADADPNFAVSMTGDHTVERDFDELSQHDLKSGELQYGVPAALLVLLLVFGAVVAGLVPLLLAIVSIVVALGLVAVLSQPFELSVFILNMLTGMGLALGIDYSLFVVSRYREERGRGREPSEAITAAGATASRGRSPASCTRPSRPGSRLAQRPARVRDDRDGTVTTPGSSGTRYATVLVLVAVGVAVIAGLIGWAIGNANELEAATETVTVTAPTPTQPEEAPAQAEATSGSQAYLDAGCGACHGLNAEGTGVGPPLPGHTADQIRQQVRSPLAQMPAYSRELLSDQELEAIADYLTGLEPGGAACRAARPLRRGRHPPLDGAQRPRRPRRARRPPPPRPHHRSGRRSRASRGDDAGARVRARGRPS